MTRINPKSCRPIRILQDPMDGKFGGGLWIAYVDNEEGRDDDVWNGSHGCDRGWHTGDSPATGAERFWLQEVAGVWWIAVGNTPNDALEALLKKA